MPGFSLRGRRVRDALYDTITDPIAYSRVYEAVERSRSGPAKALDVVLSAIEKKWVRGEKLGKKSYTGGPAPMVRPQPTPAGISSSSIPLEDRQCIALLQTLNAVVHSFPREMAELLGRESIASRVLMIVLSLRVPIDVRMVVVSLVGRWRVVLAGNRIAGKRIEAIVDAFYLNTGHSPTPEFLPAIPELCRQQRGWIYPPMILVPGQPGFFYTTVPPVRLEPEPSHPQQRQPQHQAQQQPAEPVLAPQPRSASQQAAAHTFASGGNVGGSAVAGKACMPESLTIEGVQAESSKAAAVRRVLEPTALVLATMAGSAAASGNSGGGSGSQQQLQSGLVRMSTKSRGKMPETD